MSLKHSKITSDIIEEEILRCKNITTGMLSFVRTTTYEKRKVNINDMLDRTLEIISFQGRLQGVRSIRKYSETAPVYYGNEGELRQVVLAIITTPWTLWMTKARLHWRPLLSRLPSQEKMEMGVVRYS